MKTTVSFRPRMVLKRYPDFIDRDEIGIAYDEEKNAFYLCPPDLSSNNPDELENRWAIFLRFIDLIPDFEMDESWFRGYKVEQIDAYARAKANLGVKEIQPIAITTIGAMFKKNRSARQTIKLRIMLHGLIILISIFAMLFHRPDTWYFAAMLVISTITLSILLSERKVMPR